MGSGKARSASIPTRTDTCQQAMSALPPKADMCSATRYVRCRYTVQTMRGAKSWHHQAIGKGAYVQLWW
jgi:hypothetical protein